MGAFEFSPDFDGDGTVDWLDPDADDDGVLERLDCAPLNRAISQAPDRVGDTLRMSKAGAHRDAHVAPRVPGVRPTTSTEGRSAAAAVRLQRDLLRHGERGADA